jgi:hypothetical protein
MCIDDEPAHPCCYPGPHDSRNAGRLEVKTSNAFLRPSVVSTSAVSR